MKKQFSKALLMTALICGGVYMGGIDVYAGEIQEFTLDPMVVTATRIEKRDVQVPASTVVLTQKDLKATGAQNLQVALSKVPGLVYKTFAPGGGSMGTMANEIAIRGVNNGTLVLLNGNPMNLRGKYYLDAIPVENIEKVEIIKGGASVLYGSEAMGGVINIITKKQYSNTVTTGLGNYGQQKYGVSLSADKVAVGYNLEKWGDVDTVSRSDDKGLKHTDMTGSHKNNLFLNYNINDKLQFTYNYYETNVKYDTWFDDSYKEVPKGGALQQNREYVTKQNMVQLNYSDDTWKGNMYYNQNRIMADGFTNYTTSGTKSGKMYDTDEKNRTYGLDLQKRFNFGENNLIVGASYQDEYYDDYGGDGHKKARKMTGRNIYAAYAQYDHNFDEKNEMILGARETWTTGGYKNQNYDNFSMSAQYVHKLDENQSLYASYIESFIMPTFSQMYGASESAVANADLAPQDGTNYEIGWKKVSDSHAWKAAIYHIDIKDNISAKWDTNKTEYQYSNEDFKNTGVELTCNIASDNGFSYNWGINYGDAKVKAKGNKKGVKNYWDRKYGRWQLNAGVDYTMEKWTTSLQATYLAKRVGCPSSSHSYEIKPYLLTSLSTTYKADKQNTVSLTVDNLLNREDNLSHTGSEYYSTPCNFILTYQYSF